MHEVDELLDGFRARLRQVTAVQAVWAHGSLAMGDFQPGRSDLDLVALIPDDPPRQALQALHEELGRRYPLGSALHCAYVASGRADDPGLRHPTWTQGELVDKPLTPVSRRELSTAGRVFEGPGPAEVLRPVTDAELAGFIRSDLRDFWYPATAKPHLWQRTIWVDLGSITVTRAAVTLREGQLITKAEALDRLSAMGASVALVEDIRDRRYGDPVPAEPAWRDKRAELARRFVRTTIDRLLEG